MALVQTVAPTTEPVTLQEVKDHLRITQVEDDSLLRGLIKAARHKAENYMKYQIMQATWQLIVNDFPGSTGAFIIPRPPISSSATDVTITYVNSTAAGSSSTTVSSTLYYVDTKSFPGRVYPNYELEWPTDGLTVRHGVTVQFVSGYASAADVPEPIKLWIKMAVGAMYEYREPGYDNSRLEMFQEVPRWQFNGLLDPYCMITFAT